MLLSKTSEEKSEIRDAPVPASAERESGTSYDMLERIKNAKDFIEIGIDAEEYYRIKDSEKAADGNLGLGGRSFREEVHFDNAHR